MLFRKTTRLAVKATGAAGAAGWGAALLTAAHPDDDVRDLIRRWFGRDVPNPYVQIVGNVEAELVTAGLLSAVEEDTGLRGKAGRMLRGKPDVEADCDRIGVLAGAVALAVERWRQWGAAEPELVPLLLEECRAGITSRERDND